MNTDECRKSVDECYHLSVPHKWSFMNLFPFSSLWRCTTSSPKPAVEPFAHLSSSAESTAHNLPSWAWRGPKEDNVSCLTFMPQRKYNQRDRGKNRLGGSPETRHQAPIVSVLTGRHDRWGEWRGIFPAVETKHQAPLLSVLTRRCYRWLLW